MRTGKWIALCVCWLALVPSVAGAQSKSDEKLSEIEQLKVEKAFLLSQVAELSKDRAAWRLQYSDCVAKFGKVEAGQSQGQAQGFGDSLVAEIESSHKGYTLNAQGQLVKKKE